MWKKLIECGPETKKKFLKGVLFVDNFIGSTLGPGGTNKVVQMKYQSPWVHNDGAEHARRIVLDDPIEDLAAQVVIEVAMRTAEQAGDGTTTSVVLAGAIVKHGFDVLKEGNKSELEGGAKKNPMQLLRDIRSEKDKAVELLKGMAKPVKDKDLDNIIATSLENLEYGKTLGELIRKIGKEGYISVEDNWATKYGISTEVVEGMKFLGTYASPYLATSSNRKEAVWDDARVLVTNHKLEAVSVFKELLKEIGEAGVRKLVIVGGYSEGESGFSKPFIESIAKAMVAYTDPKTVNRGDIIQVLAVKAPSLTSPELDDISSFLGATFIDKKIGMELPTVKMKHLGFAKKVSVTDDEVNIMGGAGNPKERVKVLREQLELERDVMFKEKLKRRIANLTSGQGIIRVGAQTGSERSYLKEKLKDAVSAAKVALEEGYVKGGGLAYIDVAKKLGEDSVLYKPLFSINERIKENMGSDVEISKSVIDPLKVVRLALENACSGAGMLITSDGAIAEKKLEYVDYLEKALKNAWPRDDKDDWRDDEQQDLGKSNVIN